MTGRLMERLCAALGRRMDPAGRVLLEQQAGRSDTRLFLWVCVQLLPTQWAAFVVQLLRQAAQRRVPVRHGQEIVYEYWEKLQGPGALFYEEFGLGFAAAVLLLAAWVLVMSYRELSADAHTMLFLRRLPCRRIKWEAGLWALPLLGQAVYAAGMAAVRLGCVLVYLAMPGEARSEVNWLWVLLPWVR